MNDELETNGFALIPAVLTSAEVAKLKAVFGSVAGAGRRGLLALPPIAALAASPLVLDLVRSYQPGEPRPVRALAFDKSPSANWLVAWHQDLTIAVRERREVPGFGPWSTKHGVPHVQPPVELLEQMLAVRLHLDAADETNGALRVLPGTHRLGRLTPEQIAERTAGPGSNPPPSKGGARGGIPDAHVRKGLSGETHERYRLAELIRAAPGDALLMRPLLLHASSRASTPAHRRVLHIEYAAFELPAGLDWRPAA